MKARDLTGLQAGPVDVAEPGPDERESLPLTLAKAHWLMAEWQNLVALDAQALERHPHRELLALLVACAHQQLGDAVSARERLRLALQWGCDRQLVARLLLSGLHNTLGRIGALKGDDAMTERHFRQAMSLPGDRESSAAMHSRAVREMASLGLLPQAAALLKAELDSVSRETGRPVALAARIEMLRSEVEILQHELSLAQQRNQLLARSREAALPAPAEPTGAESDIERLQRLSLAQLGQDLWVLERTRYKRGGYFVEFGATDGVRLSNTYLLESEFGWQGICAEPNPAMFEQLRRNRRCVVTDACIGGRSGEIVEFLFAEEFGGMVKDMASDMHAKRRQAYHADPANRASLVTVSLDDLLTRHRAPATIDYISIDTEGSEFEVLRGFPFERWNVRLFTIEHNFSATRQPVRELLESKGYRCTEAKWDDWFEKIN